MLYYIFYAGQVDGDAHIKDEKAGRNGGML